MRVLVVEDEPTMLSALSDALTHERLAVDTALDGRDALGRVHIEQAYDLVLLDLMMPHMDGLTFLRTIRSEGYAMPVLVLTARDLTNDKVTGLDAGADDYLTKPFDLGELLARVRALLRRDGNRKTSVLRARDVELDIVTHDTYLQAARRCGATGHQGRAAARVSVAQPGTHRPTRGTGRPPVGR